MKLKRTMTEVQMTKWVKEYQDLMNSLSIHFRGLKEDGVSEKEASKIIADKTTGAWDAESLLERYRYNNLKRRRKDTPRHGLTAYEYWKWDEKKRMEAYERSQINRQKKKEAWERKLAKETPEQRMAREEKKAEKDRKFHENLQFFFGKNKPAISGIAQEMADLVPEDKREEFLKSVHRLAAKNFHPDKGGDEEKMKQLNEIWEQHSK